MPRKLRTAKRLRAFTDRDIISLFRWSTRGAGLQSFNLLGLQPFATLEDAREGWGRVRRAMWAECHRFRIPPSAETFDGLSWTGFDALARTWNAHTVDLEPVLEALRADRDALDRFALTPDAADIQDCLVLLRGDLATLEDIARACAAAPWGSRPNPYLLNAGRRYGGKDTPHVD